MSDQAINQLLDRIEYALSAADEMALSIALEDAAELAPARRLAAFRQLGETYPHPWLLALHDEPGSPAWQTVQVDIDQLFPVEG